MLKNMYHKYDGLLFVIQAKYYLHLKFTRTLFTQILKNMYHKCGGLLFAIQAECYLRLHGHSNPNIKIHNNKPQWRGRIIGIQSYPTIPRHTQQQRRVFICIVDPPPSPVLHDVADGREGDAANRSLVYDLPTRVKAHLITQVEMYREAGGD